jgi:hypothetical protein
MSRWCQWDNLVDGLEGWHGEIGMRVSRRGGGRVLRALIALALVAAPFHLSINGPVASKAYAGKGGNGGGNGGDNGGGNGNGGAGANSGNNANGNSNGNGNNGNSNSGGNSSNGKSNPSSSTRSRSAATASRSRTGTE